MGSRPSSRAAVMFELNNKYALDGRDPNAVGFSGPSADMIGHGPPERPISGRSGT
jgi:hypothetical protein